MEKELSEMTLEELWELFPIILKEYNIEYPNWCEIEAFVGKYSEIAKLQYGEQYKKISD